VKLSTRLPRKGTATPDAVLLQEASAGSAVALATLYDRYESKVFNFCLRLTGSREDAADATQEAFLGVLRKLKTGDAPVLNFSAYLFTAARHESYKVIRRRGRAYPSGELPERRDASDELPPLEADPERAAIAKTSQDEIRSANGRLPPRYREVLALHDLEGASYAQIGEIMGMRSNAVAQLIFRARKRLRSELQAGAVASFVAVSDDCRRAQALISMREDGELHDEEQAEWLDRHLDECGSCRGSRAALVEVGAVYGAWLPVAALVGLREDVLARGSELIGADWMAESGVSSAGGANGGGANGGSANGGVNGGSASGGSSGAASHAATSSARFAGGAIGTAAAGLGVIGLLTLLPGDNEKRAAAEPEASKPPAAQAAAEPARGADAGAARAARGTGEARDAPPKPGDASEALERPSRFSAPSSPRPGKEPSNRILPREQSPPPGPRQRRPRRPPNGNSPGPPVGESPPPRDGPPVAPRTPPGPPVAEPPPAPPLEEPPPGGCTHPWKPTPTKPCPPGHAKPKRES
jgi:RNA polymerase sigma factor (sigma-70 family)